MATLTRWQTQRMVRAHLPGVVAIERAHGGPAAWQEAEFRAAIDDRGSAGLVVAAGANAVAGFCCFGYAPDSVVVLNIGVHPNWLRRGVASSLLTAVKGEIDPIYRPLLVCDVRERDLALQLLLKANGLRCSRCYPDVYLDSEESCLVFHYAVKGVRS